LAKVELGTERPEFALRHDAVLRADARLAEALDELSFIFAEAGEER
jgi:hypothetical protein